MSRGLKKITISPKTHRRIRPANISVLVLLVTFLATACRGLTHPAADEQPPKPTTIPDASTSAISLPEIPRKDQLQFQHLTTDDGLSEGRVWDILQDRPDFMRFMTYNGPQ